MWHTRKQRDYKYSAEHLQKAWDLFIVCRDFVTQLCDDEEHFSEISIRFPRFVFTYLQKYPEYPVCLQDFKGYLRICIRKNAVKRYQSISAELRHRIRYCETISYSDANSSADSIKEFIEHDQIKGIFKKVLFTLNPIERLVLLKVLIEGLTPSEYVDWSERELGTQRVNGKDKNFMDSAKVMRTLGNAIRKSRFEVVRHLQAGSEIFDARAYNWAAEARLIEREIED